MNCFFYYHMRQRIYLAEIKGERHEAMRLEHELDKHTAQCAECNGLSIEPLENNLFQQKVIVANDYQN